MKSHTPATTFISRLTSMVTSVASFFSCLPQKTDEQGIRRGKKPGRDLGGHQILTIDSVNSVAFFRGDQEVIILAYVPEELADLSLLS